MKVKRVIWSVVACLFCVAVLSPGHCQAKDDASPSTLTKKGQQLEARYTAELEGLREKIKNALPRLDSKQLEAFLNAGELERAAEEYRDAKLEELKQNQSRQALPDSHKDWISRATAELAEAREDLKTAQAMTGGNKADAIKAAQEALAKREETLSKATSALKESTPAAAEAKKEEPKCVRALEDAEKKFVAAKANTQKALKSLNLEKFLACDKLDAMLLKFEVLFESTPTGLAEFAQRGSTQEKLVEALLDDNKLMKQMLVADGAQTDKDHRNKNGYARYGEAMKIYADIKRASKNMQKDPVLQRLALACAMVHAVPVQQSNPEEQTNAPPYVNPVKRYLHFEKAFLDGELDPVFKDLRTWELRFVVGGDETEEALVWGREMLRNYRPDHFLTDDSQWRYVDSVRSDISYGSQYNKYDEPRLQKYQNILKNGGVCGRRAFFGRFILRAFGIPVVARPQPGHAALAHWTPDGWVVCLGARWGIGSTSTQYRKDLNFLESTQAREDEDAYLKVKRAQWIADVLDEPRMYGLYGHRDPIFEPWTAISLYTQRGIIDDLKAKTLDAVGTEVGESNERMEDEGAGTIEFTKEDKTIAVAGDGTITIPAAACITPTESTNKILFMESLLGGKQLHYAWRGDYESFEYVVEVPEAGQYELTARVVTPSWKQNLLFSVNDGKSVNIDLPYTLGMWESTKPVKISLKQGKNHLRFFREERQLEDARDKGISIRDFTLKPTK